MKPYIYEDPEGDQLKIEDGAITAIVDGGEVEALVGLPGDAEAAIELAQKILEGAGVRARIVTV
ncbi:hypothetical protein [Nocardiopsis synnemataformans]|uniref:hypothetical protein n=1 Tax=Nocardiopsis synnemataformans TaxID=61305 RepID=UPI003EBA2F45